MKNVIKLVCIAACLAMFAGTLLTRPAASKDAADRKGSAESSRPLYLNNCARCHGADGKGQTELGRLNETPDISGGRARRLGNAGVTRIITRGKGSMPAFGRKLTRPQIAGLVAYVRGL